MEDGILYNLPHIKRYVLDDGKIKQGTFGRNFTHIRRRNETRSDEVMQYLRDVGQMFGLEVHRMPVCLFLYRLKTPQINIITRALHFSCIHVTLDKFA